MQIDENKRKLLEAVCEDYFANNMKKLRAIIDKTALSFGGIIDSDYDDFISKCMFHLIEIVNRFDASKGVPIDAYIRSFLPNKIKEYKTHLNREKRTAYLRDCNGNVVRDEDGKPIIHQAVYLDATFDGDSDTLIGETIDAGFDMDEALGLRDSRVETFLNRLSKEQKQIVCLLEKNYPPREIKVILHMTNSEYQNNLDDIRSYRNISVLMEDADWEGDEDEYDWN